MKAFIFACVVLCASAATACDQNFSAFRGQCLQGYSAPFVAQPFVGYSAPQAFVLQQHAQPIVVQQFGYGQAFVAQPFVFGNRRAIVVRDRGVFGRPLLVPRVRSFRF